MKKTIKIILYKFLGKRFYDFIKPFYTPSDSMKTKLRFIDPFEVKTKDGKHFYLFNNGFSLESTIYWSGGIDNCDWEPMTRAIWTELCKSADTIFDIGSNSGIFSVLAKVYNTNSKVYAFEPQPNIFNVLKKNNEINNFNIQYQNIALSDKEGNVPFYNYGKEAFTTENTTAGSLNKDWRIENQNSIMVVVKELKSFIEENNIKSIDLIKIDVETFEYEVLSGYGTYLNVHKPIIILEIQNRIIGKNIESLFSDTISYSFFNIDENAGLIKVENLGWTEKNNNYLLCPESKQSYLKKFIF
jgi:FkbM family methyltransferase